MTEKIAKPQLRFAGFDDTWEQRKFGEITSKYENPVPTPHDGYYRLCIRSHAKGTFHSYVAKGQELETAQMHRVAAGNFIVNITFGWEHAVAITDKNDAGKLVSHRFPQFSFAEGMVPEFFRYVIVDEKFRHHLWLASPGGAGRNRVLKLDEMLNYLMRFPSRDEQIKIAEFFRHLDNLITLHQRKYDKLTNVKKSMLEKMFPKNGSNVPEIRFKGFSDAWEQRKLGTTKTFFTDGNYGEAYPKASDMTNSSEGVPFLTGSNLKEGKLDISDASYITKEKHEKLISGHLVEDDIVIAVRGSLGSLGYVNKGNSGWNINSQLAILRTDKTELYGKFLLQFLISDLGQNELLKRQTGSALKQLPIGAIKDVEVPITSVEEQTQIGEYFSSLDNLITLHQRELEKLKNLKKACLEKMFV